MTKLVSPMSHLIKSNITEGNGVKSTSSTETNIGIRPVVRHIIRANIEPSPDDAQARIYTQLLKEDWNKSSSQYLNSVRNVSEAHDCDFSTDEIPVSVNYDGSFARVVNYQRVRTQRSRCPFDTRLCTAVCTKNASTNTPKNSSKNIARVGLPYGDEHPIWLPGTTKDIHGCLENFRRIAHNGANWGYEQLERVLASENVCVNQREHLEIVTLGSNDERVANVINSFEHNSLDEILESNSHEQLLSTYFGPLADAADFSIKDFADSDSGNTWFSIPVPVKLANNRLDSRDVLYWMRSTGNSVILTGLGYDDTMHGDLAQKSVLSLSRWLGTRI